MRRRQPDYLQEKEDTEFERKLFYGVLIASTITSILLVGGGAATWGWYVASSRQWAIKHGGHRGGNDNNNAQAESPQADVFSFGNNNNHNDDAYPQDDDVEIEDDFFDRDRMPENGRGEGALLPAVWPVEGSTVVSPQLEDNELQGLTQELWALDVDRLKRPQLVLNPQTDLKNGKGTVEKPLFKNVAVDLSAWSDTHNAFINLLDNYQAIVKQQEHLNNQQNTEIDTFLDAIISTDVMGKLHEFLAEKGFISRDVDQFRILLHNLWFEPYPRSSKYNTTDSSGFEHVFVGEIRGKKVIGFHSWIQFYLEERAGNIQYQGYNFYRQNVINAKMQWRGKRKKETSFFIGTTPQYEVAVYTLCILARPNRNCPIDVDGLQVTIESIDISYMPGLQVGTSFLRL